MERRKKQGTRGKRVLVDFSFFAGTGCALARIFREIRAMRMRGRARDIHFLAYMTENDLICILFWIICKFLADERHYGGYQVGGIR